MNETYAFIGAGKVGLALATKLLQKGERIQAFGGRDAERLQDAVKVLPKEVPTCSVIAAAEQASVVFLTVSDNALALVVQVLLAAKIKPETLIIHCSGALSSQILDPLKEKFTCKIASLHPLQTFSSVAIAIEQLHGAYAFCESDEVTEETLKKICEIIGMHFVPIKAEDKVLYHAASVMACNYLSVLMDAVLKLTNSAKIDQSVALKAFAPLVEAAMQNIFNVGPTKALTGPIVRGDDQTVSLHQEAIEKIDSQILDLYSVMGRSALEMAKKKNADLSLDQITALSQVLKFKKPGNR